MKRLANYEEILKKNSYKLTSQRKEILNLMLDENNKYLSCEEIYEIIKKNNIDIGLATVYRTIQVFEKIGIVNKFYLDNSSFRYELVKDDKMHNMHHIICEKCSKIDEIEEDLLENLEKVVIEKYKFKIKNHNLNFIGLCFECSNK